MNLLLINGVSGSGKTTLAKTLEDRNSEIIWIHPDGLMDTPVMVAEEILSASLSLAGSKDHSSTLIIDCQIRPSSIDELVRPHSLRHTMILLDCPRKIREQRLKERGWTNRDFEKIDAWASTLRDETRMAGHAIFDTSVTAVNLIAALVERSLRDDD